MYNASGDGRRHCQRGAVIVTSLRNLGLRLRRGVALSKSHLLFVAVLTDVLAKDLGDESGLDLVQHLGLRGSNAASFVNS